MLELTAPRVPCAVFADRMGERAWVKRFRAAGRPGAYARVLEEGEVEAGDAVELIPAPIAERERHELEERLAQLA